MKNIFGTRRAVPRRSTVATIVLLTSVPLALAAPGLCAAQSPQRARDDTAAQSRPLSHTVPLASLDRDVQPFLHAKLSLLRAVNDSRRTLHGTPLEARFEVWHGKPAYVLRTYRRNRVWQARIDANTGKLLGPARLLPSERLAPNARWRRTAKADTYGTFMRAVRNAEQRQGGTAIMARVMQAPPVGAIYRVDLVRDGRVHTAMVNARTNKLE